MNLCEIFFNALLSNVSTHMLRKQTYAQVHAREHALARTYTRTCAYTQMRECTQMRACTNLHWTEYLFDCRLIGYHGSHGLLQAQGNR